MIPRIIGTSMSPNPPVATDLVLFIGAPQAVPSIGLRAQSLTHNVFPF